MGDVFAGIVGYIDHNLILVTSLDNLPQYVSESYQMQNKVHSFPVERSTPQ